MNFILNQRYAYEEIRYVLFFEFKYFKGEKFFQWFKEKQQGSFSQRIGDPEYSELLQSACDTEYKWLGDHQAGDELKQKRPSLWAAFFVLYLRD